MGRVGLSKVEVSYREVTGVRQGVTLMLAAKGCQEVADIRVRGGFVAISFVP